MASGKEVMGRIPKGKVKKKALCYINVKLLTYMYVKGEMVQGPKQLSFHFDLYVTNCFTEHFNRIDRYIGLRVLLADISVSPYMLPTGADIRTVFSGQKKCLDC